MVAVRARIWDGISASGRDLAGTSSLNSAEIYDPLPFTPIAATGSRTPFRPDNQRDEFTGTSQCRKVFVSLGGSVRKLTSGAAGKLAASRTAIF